MAIRHIKKALELPPAHLFLEDIEDIAEAMKATSKAVSPVKTQDDIQISYEIGDTECDSIDDLKKLGGKTRKFEMRAAFASLILSSTSAYCSSEKPLFDTVLKVMTAREMKLKGAIRHMLAAVGKPVLALIATVVLVAATIKYDNTYTWLVIVAVVLSCYAVAAWADFTHSIVELRYYHERPRKAVLLQQWAGKAIWIILGVFLTGFAQWLWNHLTTKH